MNHIISVLFLFVALNAQANEFKKCTFSESMTNFKGTFYKTDDSSKGPEKMLCMASLENMLYVDSRFKMNCLGQGSFSADYIYQLPDRLLFKYVADYKFQIDHNDFRDKYRVVTFDCSDKSQIKIEVYLMLADSTRASAHDYYIKGDAVIYEGSLSLWK